MNLNPTGRWDMRGNISRWWTALAASALTGMDGLGSLSEGRTADAVAGPPRPVGNSAGTLNHLSG